MSSEGNQNSSTKGHLSFLKGSDEFLSGAAKATGDWAGLSEKVRAQLAEAFSARNVAFLLGSGASSLEIDGTQWGIPTMGPMAKEFFERSGKRGDRLFLTSSEKTALKSRFGIDVQNATYTKNIEKFLEVLYSLRLVLSQSKKFSDKSARALVSKCIIKAQSYIFAKCTDGAFGDLVQDTKVVDLYSAFYRKLVFRDKTLPRPWVFTTNYDLFSETALDRLGLPYCNGFSGTIERRFNPSTYRYALAEQIDTSQRRWTAVDGFIYFCKLHGSVSWIEDDHGLYPIRELQMPSPNGRIMIYPTPAKQNSSFGSPYSDLFREFQSRIVREQSVLFVIGYSFSDEHVNNIIYQALTIPTFRLVIFASATPNAELAKLKELKDPRIWIISGETPHAKKAHYFETVVNDLLPTQASDRIDEAVSRVVERLVRPQAPSGGLDE